MNHVEQWVNYAVQSHFKNPSDSQAVTLSSRVLLSAMWLHTVQEHSPPLENEEIQHEGDDPEIRCTTQTSVGSILHMHHFRASGGAGE